MEEPRTTPLTAIAQIAKLIGQELESGAGPSEQALATGPMLAEAGATTEIVERLFAEAQRKRPNDRIARARAMSHTKRKLIHQVSVKHVGVVDCPERLIKAAVIRISVSASRAEVRSNTNNIVDFFAKRVGAHESEPIRKPAIQRKLQGIES